MMVAPPNKKNKIITELYNMCKSRNDFTFTNSDVRKECDKIGFGNHFDVTKLDSIAKLPNILTENDSFIIHLGCGKHKFVRGIDKGYHEFEAISHDNTHKRKCPADILDNINTSASNVLSVAYNHGIIHDFLHQNHSLSPKIYGAHKTYASFDCKIGNSTIIINNVQIGVDFITEFENKITLFKATASNSISFNTFQLFNPYRYYLDKTKNMTNVSISCCYLLRHNSSNIRLYLYSFTDKNDPSSIKIVHSAEYTGLV